jgi:hypothetical protein
MRRAVMILAAFTLVTAALLVSPRGYALPSSPNICSSDAPLWSVDWVQTGYAGQTCAQVLVQAEVASGDHANNTCDNEGESLCYLTDDTATSTCTCYPEGQCSVHMHFTFQCTVCNPNYHPSSCSN